MNLIGLCCKYEHNVTLLPACMVTGVILLFCGGIGVSTNHFGTECLPESETDEMRYVLYLRVFIRSARVAIR